MEASAEALNEIAHVYYRAGQFDQARARLEQALPTENHAARTHNNLANVLVAQGELEAALSHYESAIAAEEGDGGPWLNLGLVRHASGDTLAGERAVASGISRTGGYEQACRLLGLEPEPGLAREGTQRLSSEAARQLLKAALQRIPATAVPDSSRGVRGDILRRRQPKWTSRSGGGRGHDDLLDDLLYWKR